MVRYGSVVILLCSVALLCYAVSAMADNPLPSGCATKAAVEIQNPLTPNVPPKGFIALFNGNDLAGWRGLGHVNPLEIAKWNDQERIAKQKEADADMARHWRVEEGQIINDGHGVYLTTVKDYGDFELILDWCMMVPNADSGIYLRGSPQVQIWDPHGKTETATGIEKGSGALWNNEKPEGKFPPVVADKSIGEWNTFRILMIGQRVTVDFNGKRTVDNAIMENYWDRGRPIFPRGPIQLQTHGGEMRFRNVFIREIIPEEADKALQARDDKGFESIFNGKDLSGWTRETEGYMVKDGALVTKKDGGTILTREQYDDFAIRFEFKLPPDGNNGLAVRAPLEGNPAFAGMEIQILDDTAEQYAKLAEWQYHGSVYGVVPAHRGYLRPTGEWNFEEVVVQGTKVRVNLNGTVILDADLAQVKQPPDGREHPGLRRSEGHIGFMGHGYPVEFRNIRVKKLK